MTKPIYNLSAKQIVLTYNKLDDFDTFLAFKNIKFDEINPRSVEKYADVQIIKLSPKEKDCSFDDADKFYKLCSRKNSRIKIIYDDFSVEKARKLYDKFVELETYIRMASAEIIAKNGENIKFYHRKRSRRGKNRLQYYKPSKPDHKVSQTSLDELIHDILLATGNPKVIDKMRLRSVKKDLLLMHEIRNKVMHANVITDAQSNNCEQAVQNINKAIRTSLNLDLIKSIADASVGLIK